jgi:methylmalonyl-CoA mutase C-terminal domain/subunit
MSTSPAPEGGPLRVLIGKPGLDGHDRGAQMVVLALEEAGMAVEYTGIRRTPAQIAAQARSFGADVVGLSILSGAHLELIPRVMRALEEAGLETVPVVAGGIIPEHDRAILHEMGVAAIFGPGAPTSDIIAAVRKAAEARRRAAG